jgi:hypothetical protein
MAAANVRTNRHGSIFITPSPQLAALPDPDKALITALENENNNLRDEIARLNTDLAATRGELVATQDALARATAPAAAAASAPSAQVQVNRHGSVLITGK